MKKKDSNYKRNVLVFFLVCALIVSIMLLVHYLLKYISEKQEPDPQETYIVATGKITQNFFGDGVVEQAEIKEVYPHINATLTYAFCSVGDFVHMGDILFLFDTTALDNEIEEARLTFERSKIIYENSRGTDKKICEIDMNIAELQWNALTEKRKQYIVYAPMTGKILKSEFNPGDYYDSNNTIPLAIIGSTSEFLVHFIVDESYISSIETGKSVDIFINAGNPQKYVGQIESTSLLGNVGNGITTYDARAVFDTPENVYILNGMNARVTVSLLEKDNIIIIPSSFVNKDGTVTLLMDDPSEQMYRNIEVEYVMISMLKLCPAYRLEILLLETGFLEVNHDYIK